MIFTPKDLEVTAKTVYGEARGEPEGGRVAVAWVIRNRAETQYGGDTPEEVCMRPAQFSCWNPNDPNLPKLKYLNTQSEGFRQCLLATAMVFADLVPDPTNGCRHYLVAGTDASWIEGQEPEIKIGNHVFYKGIK